MYNWWVVAGLSRQLVRATSVGSVIFLLRGG